MQFGPDATTELVIPAGTPFLPGFDVIGIGTALPDELANYSPIPGGETVKAAIVFYSSAYDSNATVAQVKYYWMGIGSDDANNGSSLCIGIAIVPNASVSEVAVVTSGFALVPFAAGNVMQVSYNAVNHNDNTIVLFGESGVVGNGALDVLNNNGTLVGPATGGGSLP